MLFLDGRNILVVHLSPHSHTPKTHPPSSMSTMYSWKKWDVDDLPPNSGQNTSSPPSHCISPKHISAWKRSFVILVWLLPTLPVSWGVLEKYILGRSVSGLFHLGKGLAQSLLLLRVTRSMLWRMECCCVMSRRKSWLRNSRYWGAREDI